MEEEDNSLSLLVSSDEMRGARAREKPEAASAARSEIRARFYRAI